MKREAHCDLGISSQHTNYMQWSVAPEASSTC